MAVVSGNGFHHSAVAHLRLFNAPAVYHRVGVAVDKHFHRVQIRVFHGVGGEDAIRDLTGQFCLGVSGEIALNLKFAGFLLREGVHLVVQKICLLYGFLDQLRQLFFRGGGIDIELGIALETVVIHIHGDHLVAGVGAADGLQLALHIKALIAFLGGEIDLIIADLGVCLQRCNHSFHPNFTFTFSAGPPSLTRTHSL